MGTLLNPFFLQIIERLLMSTTSPLDEKFSVRDEDVGWKEGDNSVTEVILWLFVPKKILDKSL